MDRLGAESRLRVHDGLQGTILDLHGVQEINRLAHIVYPIMSEHGIGYDAAARHGSFARGGQERFQLRACDAALHAE